MIVTTNDQGLGRTAALRLGEHRGKVIVASSHANQLDAVLVAAVIAVEMMARGRLVRFIERLIARLFRVSGRYEELGGFYEIKSCRVRHRA